MSTTFAEAPPASGPELTPPNDRSSHQQISEVPNLSPDVKPATTLPAESHDVTIDLTGKIAKKAGYYDRRAKALTPGETEPSEVQRSDLGRTANSSEAAVMSSGRSVKFIRQPKKHSKRTVVDLHVRHQADVHSNAGSESGDTDEPGVVPSSPARGEDTDALVSRMYARHATKSGSAAEHGSGGVPLIGDAGGGESGPGGPEGPGGGDGGDGPSSPEQRGERTDLSYDILVQDIRELVGDEGWAHLIKRLGVKNGIQFDPLTRQQVPSDAQILRMDIRQLQSNNQTRGVVRDFLWTLRQHEDINLDSIVDFDDLVKRAGQVYKVYRELADGIAFAGIDADGQRIYQNNRGERLETWIVELADRLSNVSNWIEQIRGEESLADRIRTTFVTAENQAFKTADGKTVQVGKVHLTDEKIPLYDPELDLSDKERAFLIRHGILTTEVWYGKPLDYFKLIASDEATKDVRARLATERVNLLRRRGKKEQVDMLRSRGVNDHEIRKQLDDRHSYTRAELRAIAKESRGVADMIYSIRDKLGPGISEQSLRSRQHSVRGVKTKVRWHSSLTNEEFDQHVMQAYAYVNDGGVTESRYALGWAQKRYEDLQAFGSQLEQLFSDEADTAGGTRLNSAQKWNVIYDAIMYQESRMEAARERGAIVEQKRIHDELRHIAQEESKIDDKTSDRYIKLEQRHNDLYTQMRANIERAAQNAWEERRVELNSGARNNIWARRYDDYIAAGYRYPSL